MKKSAVDKKQREPSKPSKVVYGKMEIEFSSEGVHCDASGREAFGVMVAIHKMSLRNALAAINNPLIDLKLK